MVGAVTFFAPTSLTLAHTLSQLSHMYSLVFSSVLVLCLVPK